MRPFLRVWLAVMYCAVGLLITAESTAGQRDELARERWQRVPEVMSAMGVEPGARVADVGSGAGFFTVRLADAVGETGRVYAVDISPRMVEQPRERALREGHDNVHVVLSTPEDPHLPEGELDAILVVNTYHEFTHPEDMLAGFAAALRPGGRLVIVDPVPQPSRLSAGRSEQERRHELGSWFAVEDLARVGFRIARLEDPFILVEDTPGRHAWWLLVAERVDR